MVGPLQGLRIVEIAGIGPGPFAAMMLADHGAEVIRVDRPGAPATPWDPLLRSRKSIVLDLKAAEDIETLRILCRTADGLIEGFRPGVMERLGLGPDVLLGDNPQLVYGRVTGWGQEGPLARRAGHDINYIALSGVLGMIGRAGEAPVVPLNLAADFGGGAMMLAFGLVSAMLAVRSGAPGQVVDCAMSEGSALLAAMMWGFRGVGRWDEVRGTNLLDGGAPNYGVFETSDGGYMAVGAIEPQFHALLLAGLGLPTDQVSADPFDRAHWEALKPAVAAAFASRTRAEWMDVFADSDACVTPVLSMSEALAHPHNRARNVFAPVGGVVQPMPAPRYSVTECRQPAPPCRPGADTQSLRASLKELPR